MVGLQGSGKTTTTRPSWRLLLQTRDKKRVLMASLDTTRPAAMEQLKVLGEQAGVATLADHRRARARSTSPSAPWRRRRSAAMTPSFSTPPAASMSTKQLMAEVASGQDAGQSA